MLSSIGFIPLLSFCSHCFRALPGLRSACITLSPSYTLVYILRLVTFFSSLREFSFFFSSSPSTSESCRSSSESCPSSESSPSSSKNSPSSFREYLQLPCFTPPQFPLAMATNSPECLDPYFANASVAAGANAEGSGNVSPTNTTTMVRTNFRLYTFN
jgi:hypothetical protein